MRATLCCVTRAPRAHQDFFRHATGTMSTVTAPSSASHISESAQPPQKKFSPLVQQFLDYLHLEKHFSDYTVKSYGADLIQFGQFLAGEIGHHNADPPLNVVFPETPASLDEKQVKCEPLQI